MKPNRESRARDKSVPAPSDNPADMSDIVWLVGDDGAAELAQLADVQATPAVAAQLRRRYSAERVRLLLDQTELRKRARVKFRDADRMFFTRTLLEQATDEACAAYKAARFPISADRREAIADICCGIGGDLISLARR